MKRPYELTLTKSERDAIDWVGYRYRHGDDLRKILEDTVMEVAVPIPTPDPDSGPCTWDLDTDVTFRLTEPQAWLVHEIMEDDPNFSCFSEDLTFKLLTFCEHIV